MPEPSLILVAEDDLEMRRLLRAWIEEEGFVVEEVCTGLELVERIADSWLGSPRRRTPDLVVSDNRMPGFEGLAVLGALHRIKARIPFIFLTGYADEDFRQEALRFGALGVLDKPVERKSLLDTVAGALGHT